MVDKTISNDMTGGYRNAEKVSLPAGTILGDYKIIEELGRGGMGVVYLAEHIELRTRYALKILPDDLSRSPQFIERFKNEARIMARLNHPGIVRVFNFGSTGGHYYLVMDLVLSPKGNPRHLGHLIQERGGRLSPDETQKIILQVCDALEYAHSYQDDLVKDGVVHRDLKPANILLTSGKRRNSDDEISVRVSDFGLAKIVGEDFLMSRITESFSRSMSLGSQPTKGQRTPISSDDAILGTYDYMSPEQKDPLRAGAVDKRSDIFSLGVIAYRLLTGKKPEGFFKMPSRIDSSIPLIWDEIIGQALQPEPDDRYSFVAKIAEILGNKSDTTASVIHINQKQVTPSPIKDSPPAQQVKQAEAKKKFCDLCGREFDVGDNFCAWCGSRIFI